MNLGLPVHDIYKERHLMRIPFLTLRCLALVGLILVGMVRAQEDPAALLKDLQDTTKKNERSELRLKLVNLGWKQLLDGVKDGQKNVPAELVSALRQQESSGTRADGNVTCNMVLALHELVLRATTEKRDLLPRLRGEFSESLRAALDSADFEVRYVASRALELLWEGDAGQTPECSRINGQLYTMALSASALAEVNSAVRAIVKINPAVKVEMANVWPAPALKDEELREAEAQLVNTWRQAIVKARDDAVLKIPKPEDQDWRSLIQTIVVTDKEADRKEAADVLAARADLTPLDWIVFNYFQQPDIKNQALPDLCRVVSAISQVPIQLKPGMPVDERRSEVIRWDRVFLKSSAAGLKKLPKKIAKPYILADMQKFYATPGFTSRVKPLQEAFLWFGDQKDQADLNDVAQLPQEVRTWIIKNLGIKAQFQDEILPGLRSAEAVKRVEAANQIVQRWLPTEEYRNVLRIFMDDLVSCAQQEQNAQMLRQMASILTSIGGQRLPVSDNMTDADRKAAIAKWLNEVREMETK